MKQLIVTIALFGAVIQTIAQELYEMENITTIELYFSEPSWDLILDNYYAADLDERLLADSVVINGSMKDSVGVKYKGNSTYSADNDKNPMNIALDYVQNNQDYQGFRTLKLSNGKNDPSFLREVLSYEIARKYMVAPQSNYAKVYVNGVYHGLYASSESINTDFTNDYLYADGDNTRFKCNPVSVFDGNGSSLEYLGADSASYYDYYELKSDAGWQDLIDLTELIANNPAAIESSFDIDRAIWLLAFNNVVVNLDSYTGPFRQNYYLLEDDYDRMNMIVWDLNECLGGFEMINSGGGPPPSTTDLIELDPFLRQNDSAWPLLQLILNDPTYQRMYVAHMRTILDENFANGWYQTRAQELQALISNAVETDPNAFYSVTDFSGNLNSSVTEGGPGGATIGITELMEDRVSFLQSHEAFSYIPPTIGTVATQPAQATPYSNPTVTAVVDNANSVYLGYRFRPQDIFTKVEMYDDGMHDDGAAGDGVYGVSIAVDARDVQYYIYAENDDAGMFSPERAEHEFHYLAVVGDLVINELMASNIAAVADQDGEYDDWVELYNAGSVAIDLEGYFLSDNENNLSKWAFPAVTLPANDYLIVWLDGDDLQAGLHTNFRLSSNGEELFFSTPGLEVLDAIFYSAIPSDQGFARSPNGYGPFTVQEHTFNDNNDGHISVEESEIMWKLYPNPARTYVTIEVPYKVSVRVYDLLGKEHLHLENVNNQVNISTANWSAGIYLVKVGESVRKLIIQ